MKKAILPLLFALIFAASACSDSVTDNRPKIPADTTKDSNTVNFQINAAGIKPLRPGEQYVLWLKIAPDTALKMLTTLKVKFITSEDTAYLVGSFQLTTSLDSIREVLVSLERTSVPNQIGLPLMRSTTFFIDSLKKNATGILDSKEFFGDYSTLQGGLVFTSTSADTTTFTREFYLMNFRSPAYNPSLLSLPLPPKGWMYGLWAVDDNFTPHQQFFYGLFSAERGHDSDSTNDFFNYPGGRKVQRMDMPSGNIIVTIEPDFYGDSLKYMGPVPFTLLTFERSRFIEKDVNYPMVNVSAAGVPGGRINFSKY